MTEREYTVEIGSVPRRKAKAISVTMGSVTWPVAYFRDEESYQLFKEACKGRARLVWVPDD